MTVYADILFAVNFSMDFLSLFITSSIMRFKLKKKSVLAASCIGGIYGVLVVVFPMRTLSVILSSIGVSLVMCVLSFAGKKVGHFIAMYSIYWGISAALGGFMSIAYSFLNGFLQDYISKYSYKSAYNGARFFIIAGTAVIVSMIFGKFFSFEKSVSHVKMEAVIDGETYVCEGLCDSGNLLTEQISGKSVILVTEKSDIAKKIKSMPELGKRYIPYTSLGNEGLIIGIVPKSVKIDGKDVNVVIAIAQNKDFGGYDACVPLNVL